MWERVIGISSVLGICWCIGGLAWHRFLNKQVPTPVWRYVVSRICFFGLVTTILELDGRTFHFWHGIVLIALISGFLLDKSVRYKRMDDRSASTVHQTSIPSR